MIVIMIVIVIVIVTVIVIVLVIVYQVCLAAAAGGLPAAPQPRTSPHVTGFQICIKYNIDLIIFILYI